MAPFAWAVCAAAWFSSASASVEGPDSTDPTSSLYDTASKQLEAEMKTTLEDVKNFNSAGSQQPALWGPPEGMGIVHKVIFLGKLINALTSLNIDVDAETAADNDGVQEPAQRLTASTILLAKTIQQTQEIYEWQKLVNSKSDAIAPDSKKEEREALRLALGQTIVDLGDDTELSVFPQDSLGFLDASLGDNKDDVIFLSRGKLLDHLLSVAPGSGKGWPPTTSEQASKDWLRSVLKDQIADVQHLADKDDPDKEQVSVAVEALSIVTDVLAAFDLRPSLGETGDNHVDDSADFVDLLVSLITALEAVSGHAVSDAGKGKRFTFFSFGGGGSKCGDECAVNTNSLARAGVQLSKAYTHYKNALAHKMWLMTGSSGTAGGLNGEFTKLKKKFEDLKKKETTEEETKDETEEKDKWKVLALLLIVVVLVQGGIIVYTYWKANQETSGGGDEGIERADRAVSGGRVQA